MSIVKPQRDAIEVLLRHMHGERGVPKTFKVDHNVTTKEGKRLHLLGISPGTSLCGGNWCKTRVAVFLEVNGQTEDYKRCELGDDGMEVQGAVILTTIPDSNECRVRLLIRDASKGILFASDREEPYWTTTCS
ncbi:MAG: hypothetical protein V1853_02250 [bacterium]